MNVETKVIGEQTITGNIAEMTARAKDAKPATRKVKELFLESNRKTFESEGAHIGAPWAPLSEETLKRKSREGIDARPLRGKSGDLETAMKGGRGKRTSATKSKAAAGTSVFYGRILSGGAKGSLNSHNTGIPARQLAGITNNEAEKTLEIVADYVVRGHV